MQFTEEEERLKESRKIRPIYENDRKAPRHGKSEFSTVVVNQVSYNEWIKANPEYKHITLAQWRAIWDTIAYEVRNQACNNPLGIYLPFYTGELKIQYLPGSVKRVDNEASDIMGQKINHINITTKGKVAVVVWQRKRAANFNKMLNLFGFEQDRQIASIAKEAILSHSELYRTMNIKKTRPKDDKPRDNSVSEEGD